jgi:(4S)-4-hydroxy-5-phosphonooxypentane-2,3-dione isomerase
MYVVTVDFRIKAERLSEFMPLMLENARASRETEVYDDRAAFDAHLAAAHFKRFDAAVAPMVASKAVRILRREG